VQHLIANFDGTDRILVSRALPSPALAESGQRMTIIISRLTTPMTMISKNTL